MAIYTQRTGVTNHPETSVLQLPTDLVRKSGVFLPSSDFLVEEQAVPSLNVDVAIGRAYIKSAIGNCYPVNSDAVSAKAIGPNSSGNGRIDAVVLYIDLAATPNSTGEGNDVAKLLVVAGTPAPSPVAPSDAVIQTAVGANNPFIRLANVTVANGASSIVNANIANVAARVFIKTPTPIYTVTYASTINIDYTNGSQQLVVLAGDPTIAAPTNMEVGDFLLLDFVQSASGNDTLTWFSGITWDYDVVPTLATAANKKTSIIIRKTGAATYQGALYLQST
jgi:hypothetical protein